MKNLLVILLLIPFSLFSQSHLNRENVNKEFQRILNEERKNHGLSPLFIDTVHTQMEDDWSKKITYWFEGFSEKMTIKLFQNGKKIKFTWPNFHGEGEDDFEKRFKRYYPNFSPSMRGECISLYTLGEKKSDAEIARYCFEKLKSSAAHYDIMMNPNMNSMYGSLYELHREEYTKESVLFKSNYWYGFCLIVFNQ